MKFFWRSYAHKEEAKQRVKDHAHQLTYSSWGTSQPNYSSVCLVTAIVGTSEKMTHQWGGFPITVFDFNEFATSSDRRPAGLNAAEQYDRKVVSLLLEQGDSAYPSIPDGHPVLLEAALEVIEEAEVEPQG